MVRPAPGLLWDPAFLALSRPLGRIHFATRNSAAWLSLRRHRITASAPRKRFWPLQDAAASWR